MELCQWKSFAHCTKQLLPPISSPCYPFPMQTFAEEYKRLNPAQKEAVDAIEGPVMVVAGPGTGKTQVLSLRVANILKKAHVSPRNILCLTFTTSGATAMRERLRAMIGSAAYGVTIDTVHGFCNDIITKHPHVFDAFAALEQISDVEQVRSLNTIIDQLMPNLFIVNQKSPYGRTKDILARIGQIKREGVTQKRLDEVADEYETALLSKSKEGTKAYEKNASSARKLRDFVELFRRYQRMLQETQRYDYADMILSVLRACEEEDWLLQTLQERYQYILVDEFQDLNGSQYAVIEKLMTPRTPEDVPNIFVVGDDDQAIYRFQGANLQNILSFKNRFPSAKIVVLTTSYRCSQQILDAAGRLIKQNDERLVGAIPGLTKDLNAARNEPYGEPKLLRCPSDVSEPWVIADCVEDELARGQPSSEIAILVQTNSELRPIYDVLCARGIPVRMDGKVDLLDQPLVLQALSVLRGIHAPYNNPHFCAALSIPALGCHPADIGRLFQLSREREMPVLTLLLALDDPSSDVALQSWHDVDRLKNARDILLSLHQQAPSRSLADTVQHILVDCRLLPVSQQNEPLDPLAFAALQAFFEYVKYRSYETLSFSIDALLSDIELFTSGEYGLRLHFALPHLVTEGVQLMTAHQSKGLEFDTVILPNFRDGHWDKRRNPPSVSIPEDLLFGWKTDQRAFEQSQDERRVAYVAMTRARTTLIFTCPMELTHGGVKPRTVSPSGFFVEAGPLPEIESAPRNPQQLSTLLQTSVVNFDDAYRAFLLDRLKSFRLSVTALNHFLENPGLFLERDLLQKPELKTNALVFGNAVHAALRTWGLSVQEGNPIGKEQLMSAFQTYLSKREILTESERENLLAHGRSVLPRYYEERLTGMLPHVARVEYPLNADIGDIPLKGKIDRIDLDHPDGKRATIIDFKTGRPKTEKQIRDDGNYFRQLAFYALLLEQGMPFVEPAAFVLDFIGEGTEHPVTRTFAITEQDKKELREVIQAVWRKVTALDFTPLV